MLTKKLLITLAAILLITTSLVGCSKSDTTEDADAEIATEESSEEVVEEAVEEEPAVTLEGEVELVGTKAVIQYFDAQAEVEVNSVTFNFWPEKAEPILDPDDGNMFVRLGVTVTNIGDEPYYFNTTAYSLNSNAGEGDYETFLIGDDEVDDIYPYGDIAVGETITSGVYYEVSETDTLDTLELVIEGYDNEAGDIITVLELAQ